MKSVYDQLNVYCQRCVFFITRKHGTLTKRTTVAFARVIKFTENNFADGMSRLPVVGWDTGTNRSEVVDMSVGFSSSSPRSSSSFVLSQKQIVWNCGPLSITSRKITRSNENALSVNGSNLNFSTFKNLFLSYLRLLISLVFRSLSLVLQLQLRW